MVLSVMHPLIFQVCDEEASRAAIAKGCVVGAAVISEGCSHRWHRVVMGDVYVSSARCAAVLECCAGSGCMVLNVPLAREVACVSCTY
ncbi:hypothetical protein SAMN05660380_01001 [Xylella fastidiosa]|jgi:methylase of polypeptide subunit release factors|nr:hypothetical protein SAMN05660380_01001 [Xylella fastidiosa]